MVPQYFDFPGECIQDPCHCHSYQYFHHDFQKISRVKNITSLIYILIGNKL